MAKDASTRTSSPHGAGLLLAALIAPCASGLAQEPPDLRPGVAAAMHATAVPIAPVNRQTPARNAVIDERVETIAPPPAAEAGVAAVPDGQEAARVRYAQEATTLLPRELLATGRVATIDDGVAKRVDAASVDSALDRGQPLVVQRRAIADTVTLAPTPDRPSGRTVVRLPYEVIAPKADGSGALKTDVLVENLTGLVYQPQEKLYRAALQVALSSGGEPIGTKLATPVKFLVQAVRASSIDPSAIAADTLWDWQPVTIRTLDPGDHFLVRVSTGRASEASELEIQVVRPTVRVVASPTRTVGWGIGTSRLTVSSDVLAGRPVVLSARPGTLDPAAIPLDANGIGTATLRSQGTGDVKIEGDRYDLDADPVKFTSPIPFVLLGAGGGMAGATLGRKRNQRWPKVLGVGALTGVVMVTAYFVGLNWLGPQWPGIATAGEAVVAVLGAIGALVGVRRLAG